MYTDLVGHKIKVGHCFDVPETNALGKWLYRQRWLFRHGNLRKDRAEKLLALGFEDKKVLKRDMEMLSPSLTSSCAETGNSVKKRRTINSAAAAAVTNPIDRIKVDNQKESVKQAEVLGDTTEEEEGDKGANGNATSVIRDIIHETDDEINYAVAKGNRGDNEALI